MKESAKTSAINAAIAKGAKIIGRFLARRTPGVARVLLSKPASLFGVKIAPEDAAIFGANAVGLTVEAALRKLVPAIGPDILIWFNIASAAITSEYINASLADDEQEASIQPDASRAASTEQAARKCDDRSPPPEPAEGFVDLLARAMYSRNERLADMAWRLFGILRDSRLTAAQLAQLRQCDSPEKFVLLANCRNMDDLALILRLMNTGVGRGALGRSAEALASLLESLATGVSSIRERSKQRSKEHRRQAEALRLCRQHRTNPGEIFALLGRQFGLNDSSEVGYDHVEAAVTQGADGEPSPLEANRAKQAKGR